MINGDEIEREEICAKTKDIYLDILSMFSLDLSEGQLYKMYNREKPEKQRIENFRTEFFEKIPEFKSMPKEEKEKIAKIAMKILSVIHNPDNPPEVKKKLVEKLFSQMEEIQTPMAKLFCDKFREISGVDREQQSKIK